MQIAAVQIRPVAKWRRMGRSIRSRTIMAGDGFVVTIGMQLLMAARQPNVVALSPRNHFDFHDPRQPGLLSVFGHGRNDTIIVAVKVLRTSSECQHELLTGHKRHRVLSACAMDVTAEPDLRRSEGPGR